MNAQTLTPELLRDIWYSGAPHTVAWDYIDELFIAIQYGVILYDTVAICDAEKYRSNTEKFITDGPGPQSNGHMILKNLVGEWLIEKMHKDSVYESYLTGLHTDVMSRDGSIVIECGSTDPACAFVYLDQPLVQSLGIVPYPFSEDTTIVLHRFSRGAAYLSSRQSHKESLRNTFFRAKSKK